MAARGIDTFKTEALRVAQENLGWSVEAGPEAASAAGSNVLIKKSQVFAVGEGDLAIAEPEYEWTIDQVADTTRIEDIFKRRFGIDVTLGSISGGASYTHGAEETKSTEDSHTVISFVRHTTCSLNKVGLPIKTGIGEADFGDFYIAQGEMICSCQIIIDGKLNIVDITKKNSSFNISASLFKGMLEPHFSSMHRVGEIATASSVYIQVKAKGVSIPRCLMRSDHLDEDITTLLGQIDHCFKESSGQFHFTKANLKSYTPSALKAKYQRLSGIIDEIRGKLPTAITITPADQETWGLDLKDEIGRASAGLSPMTFYSAEMTAQQAEVEEKETTLKSIADRLATAIQNLIKDGLVSFGDYFRIQAFGAETLELAPDPLLDDRLAYVKSNSKSFKIKPSSEADAPGCKRFCLVTDEGLYVTNPNARGIDTTVRLTDVPSEAATWYLEKSHEGGYQLICKLDDTSYTFKKHSETLTAAPAGSAETTTFIKTTSAEEKVSLTFSTSRARDWLDVIHEISGTAAPAEITATAVTPKGCDLEIMYALPTIQAELVRRKGNYIFVRPAAAAAGAVKLHYVTSDGFLEDVRIGDMTRFQSELETMTRSGRCSEVGVIKLTREEVIRLITSNGGHTPPEAGPALSQETRNRVRHFMRDFSLDLMAAKNQSGVIIIGDTKVGKSTFANAVDADSEFFYEEDDILRVRNSRRPLAAMGTNNAKSATVYPACYPTKNSFVIVDFPGTRDTGLEKRPAQAFSMFLTKETLKEVKGVIVMIDQSLLSAGHFDYFIEVLNDLHRVFSSENRFPSLTFIVSTKELEARAAAESVIFNKIKNIKDAWEEDTTPYQDLFRFSDTLGISPIKTISTAEAAARAVHGFASAVVSGFKFFVSGGITEGATAGGGAAAKSDIAVGAAETSAAAVIPDKARVQETLFQKLDGSIQERLWKEWHAYKILSLMSTNSARQNVFAWGAKIEANDQTILKRIREHLEGLTPLNKDDLRFDQCSGDTPKFISDVESCIQEYLNKLQALLSRQESIQSRIKSLRNDLLDPSKRVKAWKDDLVDNTKKLNKCLQELALWDKEVPLEEITLVGVSFADDVGGFLKNFFTFNWVPESEVNPRDKGSVPYTRVGRSSLGKPKKEYLDGPKKETTALRAREMGRWEASPYKTYQDYRAEYSGSFMKGLPAGHVVGQFFGRNKDQTPNAAGQAIALKMQEIHSLTQLIQRRWQKLFGSLEGVEALLIEAQPKPSQKSLLELFAKFFDSHRMVEALLSKPLVETFESDLRALIDKGTTSAQAALTAIEISKIEARIANLNEMAKKTKTQLDDLREYFEEGFNQFYPLLDPLIKAKRRKGELEETTIAGRLRIFLNLCNDHYGFAMPMIAVDPPRVAVPPVPAAASPIYPAPTSRTTTPSVVAAVTPHTQVSTLPDNINMANILAILAILGAAAATSQIEGNTTSKILITTFLGATLLCLLNALIKTKGTYSTARVMSPPPATSSTTASTAEDPRPS